MSKMPVIHAVPPIQTSAPLSDNGLKSANKLIRIGSLVVTESLIFRPTRGNWLLDPGAGWIGLGYLIPAGYRPSGPVYTPVTIMAGHSIAATANLFIDTTGEVKIRVAGRVTLINDAFSGLLTGPMVWTTNE